MLIAYELMIAVSWDRGSVQRENDQYCSNIIQTGGSSSSSSSSTATVGVGEGVE